MDGDKTGASAQLRASTLSRDADAFCGERERRCGAEGDDQGGFDQIEFAFEPPAIVDDLAGGGALMQPLLAAAFELELLDRIGEIAFCPFDAGLFHRGVQQLTCWTDEWATFRIFLVARLLADKGDGGADRAFSRYNSAGAWNDRL
jgi:hypothetical protein